MAEKTLTREQARELYDDLHKAMNQMMGKNGTGLPVSAGAAVTGAGSESQAKVAKEIAQAIKAGLNGKAPASAVRPSEQTGRAPRSSAGMGGRMPMRNMHRRANGASGQNFALGVMGLFCIAKVVVSGIEASGIAEVEPAQATVIAAAPVGPSWSKEEVKVLTALDHRRAELEERSGRMDQRELELTARDRDLAMRLTELKELTDRLKIDREKGEKQRNTQLDQLANVYGSMNPPEAAHLLEQLDITVGLSLIQRMPEKRMGQILALMTPAKALEITNLLSQRGNRGQ